MKQFSRFKQFADKAFVRTDKTEVMSEDLLYAERHIDLMKLTCETAVKKLSACVQISTKEAKDATSARRIKKVPEYILGSSLDELGKKFEEGSVLCTVLSEAGKIEMTIGTQMTAHEGKIEPIIADLQKLVDNEFPVIHKLKRNLLKLSENMDAAKNKLQQANRHSMSTSVGGRIDNFKDELDESQLKVEQCRDSLASEMYQVLSKQTDIAQSIVQFLKCQQEYHRVIANTLSDLLPEVEAALASNNSNKPAYGLDLTEHLNACGRTIAYPLEFCVCALLETGVHEEGLFRIAGSASKVKKLKAAFNAWMIDSDLKGFMAEFNDPHVISNALKCYLRELPNPLLTIELYADWVEAIRVPENKEKLQSLWNVVQRLPVGHRENLRYLIKFLRCLSDHQDVNKMSSANIAIVLGPNMLWSATVSDEISQDTPMGINMAMTHWFSSIVEHLVTYADWFFPGDENFHITCEKPEPEWVSVNLKSLHGQDPLHNGGTSSEDIVEDNQPIKRSQSSSSLDEHGSPKPVVRRKVKPAPLPPTGTTAVVGPKTEREPPKPSQPQRPPPLDQSKPSASAKREGMWIPPSPSQMIRAPYVNVPPVATGGLQHPKVVPPKPPQPTFKDKPTSTDTVTTLRHKSSFRAPSKLDSTETGDFSGTSQYASASLPRRFHTDNSYKSPRPIMDVFKAEPSGTGSVAVVAKGDTAEVHSYAKKESNSAPPKDKTVARALAGLEKIVSDVVSPVKEPQPPKVSEVKPDTDTTVPESISKNPESPTSPQSEHSRPVPAPRASLHKDAFELKGTVAVVPVAVVALPKERPFVKAKPRDLAMRSHGDQSLPTHCRNSSGSGPESEGDVQTDGKSSSSQPSSRTQSRADSALDDIKIIETVFDPIRENRSSVPSEEEGMTEVIGNVPTSPKGPFRPPRPTPPAPPKTKGNRNNMSTTDF